MTTSNHPATHLIRVGATFAIALALSACGERREPPAQTPPAAPVSSPAPSQLSGKLTDTSTPAASGETAPSSGMLGRSDTAAPVEGSGTPPVPPAKSANK